VIVAKAIGSSDPVRGQKQSSVGGDRRRAPSRERSERGQALITRILLGEAAARRPLAPVATTRMRSSLGGPEEPQRQRGLDIGPGRRRHNPKWEGTMAESWCVVRKPQGDESPYVGPFTSREEAQDWADEQVSSGCDITHIRRLDFPVGPSN
jgi:hypothetical protein